jgi:hypothetical protein
MIWFDKTLISLDKRPQIPDDDPELSPFLYVQLS